MIQTLDLPDSTSPGAKTLQTALKILEEGGIVVFPTETVYGLAARADHMDALERLRAIKGRGADHPFTWHAPSAVDAREGSPWPSLMGRLTQRYWPGPLTLVRPCPNPTAGRDSFTNPPGGMVRCARAGPSGNLSLAQERTFSNRRHQRQPFRARPPP